MGSGPRPETAHTSDVDRDAPRDLAVAPAAGTGILRLQALFARGLPDVQLVAQLLQAHPSEHGPMAAWLHATAGNSYVQSVFGAIGPSPGSAWSPPIRLDPNAPPPPPKSTDPLSNGEDLDARAKKSLAEDLLKAKTDTGENAKKAVEILIEIDPQHRGKMIDELSDKSFENLLDRVPESDRERFAQLLDGTKRADRKLLLWGESHKARAENDIARHKGDAGRDAPLHKSVDEDTGEVVWDTDEEEKEEIEATYTRAQTINRKRHERRVAAVETTKSEVDVEVKRLMAKAKKGELTIADVDGMRDRKDLEYQIELENNISLTAHGAQLNNDPAVWSKPELETLRMTLARLPQVRNPDAFERMDRQPWQHDPFDGIGGQTSGGSEIDIYNQGTITEKGFRHGGDKREMVSDDFKHKYGDTIGSQEIVVTHEVGHDVAHQDKAAFEAMTKAAGWKKVKVDDLRADGVTDDDIAKLDARRSNPNANGGADIGGTSNTYAPISNSTDYWALPRTAVPSQAEAAPGSKGDDSWLYARVNPDEHFAEVYAKAVHVPEKLHDELVDRPTTAARDAEHKVKDTQQEIDDLNANPKAQGKDAKLAVLNKRLAALKQDATSKQTAKAQRAEEFRIMREGVFHTDKAVAIALERLKARKTSKAKLEIFEQRAAVASTPEQIAYLESEAMK
jgi:hypothetical protein